MSSLPPGAERPPRARARSRGTAVRSLTLLALPLLLCDPGSAQQASPGSSDRQELQRRQQSQKRALEETEARAKAAQSDLARLAVDRERLQQQLVDTARQIQQIEGQLTAIEARIATLVGKEREARDALNGQFDQIAQLLGAMQRMGRNPPPVIITPREDALEMVRSAILLAQAFPQLRDQAEALERQVSEIVKLVAESRAEGERLRIQTERLGDARIRLAALIDQKQQSLAERQKEFDDISRAARDLAQEVSNLDVFISRLDQIVVEKAPRTVKTLELTTPAAPADQSAAALPGTPPQAPSGAVVEGPMAKLPPVTEPVPGQSKAANATTIEPRPDTVLMPTANVGITQQKPLRPRIAFDEARGRLSLPVEGKRILAYGDREKSGHRVEGEIYEARFGAQVVSPADGWVVYAGAFRNYKQLLIISAGSGYYIVLAGLSRVDVRTGEWVSAAEPIGTMAPAPNSGPKGAQPALYVDFRKDGKTVDPQSWWASREDKVQR